MHKWGEKEKEREREGGERGERERERERECEREREKESESGTERERERGMRWKTTGKDNTVEGNNHEKVSEAECGMIREVQISRSKRG